MNDGKKTVHALASMWIQMRDNKHLFDRSTQAYREGYIYVFSRAWDGLSLDGFFEDGMEEIQKYANSLSMQQKKAWDPEVFNGMNDAISDYREIMEEYGNSN